MELNWMTRQQAAEWLGKCPATISNYAREMLARDMDGVLLDSSGNIQLINQLDLNEWLRIRRRVLLNERHHITRY